MSQIILSNSVLKRKLNNIRNDDTIPPDNKKHKIQEVEEHMINNIKNDTKLSKNDKNKKIKEIIIRNIQRDVNLTSAQKMEQYNKIMISDYDDYIKEMEKLLPSTSYKSKSFYNRRNNILGCRHYKKNCKIQTKCCNKWYVCKFCHNEKEFHKLNDNETTDLVCMKCSTKQPVSNKCINKTCNIEFGKYFCEICKYHNNEDDDFFHCKKCNMCIKGIKEEFKHCKKCNMCLHISIINNHKCIDNRNLASCPICSEKIKDTSDSPMILETCQHIIHTRCFSQYMLSNYKCPVCVKTITDFGFYRGVFDRFDEILEYERDQIPEEFKNAMVKIYCNDCEKQTKTEWHFEYHKCQNEQCKSFNTSIISIERDYYEPEEEEIENNNNNEEEIENNNNEEEIENNNNEEENNNNEEENNIYLDINNISDSDLFDEDNIDIIFIE